MSVAELSSAAGLTRYRFLARGYDATSGEPVYGVGRRIGIDLLGLGPGDVVLDLGCGTGLNFAGLQRRIGPTGRIVALDASPAMLGQAAARVRAKAWTNVVLVCADAQSLDVGAVRELAGGGCDAAIATYALSLMPQWRDAWAALRRSCHPDARVAVVDMQVPERAPVPLRALARLACRLGGADIDARPWRAVETDCHDVVAGQAWGGHVQVRVGTPTGRAGAPRQSVAAGASAWSGLAVPPSNGDDLHR